ncbi:alpha-L-rhamnosidase N-terminal domain-containing protein [Bacteroides sp.]|uniref:alpha-L-rhamnosidase-related protein n=1 Tax=Bacteroides sp. TaxID=29523 RepID=UPI00262682CE|nr:alpha-L-rhamnosidase N-terminal domain-containing protein [Bacteroides sp.]MDD3040601.1 alpha-L-rhamnosidase N-terminal domain-containing protein [Bacteroides sp.]
MKNLSSIRILYLLSALFIVSTAYAKLRPVSLSCEYMENPSVVDVLSPRLSWINEVTSKQARGEVQTAYRIVVASSKDKLVKGEFDIWDTGKRKSSDSYLIPYEGQQLQSAKDYWWRVMTWNGREEASVWSEPAYWGMGLLSADEWRAKWIGVPWQGEAPRKALKPNSAAYPSYPSPLFRKLFSVKDGVVSAKVFVTGLGYFELYMNGERVGDDYLVPNFTNYTVRDDLKYANIAIDNRFRDYRVMYLAYDITRLLREKENVAGAIVGNGFYDCVSHWVCPFGSPRFLCQIEVTYEDGSKDIIGSDETWKVKESPIVMDGVFDGEIYDANAEVEGWATVKCDDSKWNYAILRQAPTGILTAHTAPTDKITEELHPITFKKLEDSVYEVDFGKEISGWLHLKDIKGQKGDTLNVKYICESPLGIQQYILKGDGKESYAPRFTWYVFSKAIISGLSDLSAKNVIAEAVNTDVNISSEFKTSNSLFNRINEIWQRSQLDNMHGGVASDCPHRERSAYTGDGQVACVTVMHNFNAAAFYQKWIRDIRDVQNIETGYVPNGAPWQPGCGGGVPWGAAMNIMPWEFYLHYGDKGMLETNYWAMKEQVRYMLQWLTADGTMLAKSTNCNSDEPNYWLNLGDWAPAFAIPLEELVHTFYLWRCADYTAKAAKAIGNPTDFKYFSELAERVKIAFHGKFYDKENKTYGDYGSNIFALVMGVPEESYKDVVATLRQEIVEKYKNHLNTGIFGTQFFFETLSSNGLNDLAYEVMNQSDFPSYGYWIAQGATTTWEQWNGQDSRNHPMFGGGLTWFYRTLAGVNTDESNPGYRHLIIKPALPQKLSEVYYSNMTPFGKLVSEVRRNPTSLELNISIPVGSVATVYIPVNDSDSIITENGKPIASAAYVEMLGIGDGYCKVKVGQGNYRFLVKK